LNMAPIPALAGRPPTCHFGVHCGLLGRLINRSGTIEPCIPTRASKPPVGHQWIHEIKHDGYRLIARKRDGRVRLFTRRGYDWTDRYPRIGEAVYCDESGVALFDRLHSRALRRPGVSACL
jgi:ATP-dependent DNA ligase